MIGLLQNFENPTSRSFPTELKGIHFGNQQSKLRKLLIEELVKCLYHHDMDPEDFDFDDLDGVDDMILDLVRTHKRFIKDKDSFFDSFTKRDGKEKARWEDFMVPDGMKLLWARDATGESILEKRKISEMD